MVIDGSSDPQSVQAFSEQARSEIEPPMAEIGVTGEPEVTFWRKLKSHDEVGWES